MSLITPDVILSNGVKMPRVGLGTWDQGPGVTDAIKTALKAGYRSIDTGSFYQNEAGIGVAVREGGVAREDIFVTTKVWNSEQGYDEALRSFHVSLDMFKLDYIDLFLVHWPVAGKSAHTWRALETLYEQGLVRAIGVSNFEIHHLEELAKTAKITPMVNQIDLHPRKASFELCAYCKERGIQMEAWSPLAQGTLFDNPVLMALAADHGRTVSQIILRWLLQRDIVVIPKSNNPARLAENIAVFDFALSDDAMAAINALDENFYILGFTPDELLPVLLEPPIQPWPYSL